VPSLDKVGSLLLLINESTDPKVLQSVYEGFLFNPVYLTKVLKGLKKGGGKVKAPKNCLEVLKAFGFCLD